MNPEECKRFELEIVDDILGNLPQGRAQALQNHLAWCRSCRKLQKEWLKILESNISDEPPASLYRRLKGSYLRQRIRRRLFRPATLWGAASVAMMAIFILAITAIQGSKPLQPWEQLHVAPEDIPSFIMDDAKTVRYQVEPQNGQLSSLNGIIWINGRRDEIYCYMMNLENKAEHDYQIWLVKPIRKENGGLLRIMNGNGQLYLQQRNIAEVQQISLSLEPKGGSLAPTAEDIVLVDLKLGVCMGECHPRSP